MMSRMSMIAVAVLALSNVRSALASALSRPEEKKASSIFASQFKALDSFQESCQSRGGCGDEAEGSNAASVWSFLEVNNKKPSFDRGAAACNWTVYYDTWAPTFDKGEYEHAWEGGQHCLEACCHDPNCKSLQLLSSEMYQCYKYSKTPLMKGTGKLLSNAHWLVQKRKAWSVFVKGTPEEVTVNIAQEQAKVTKSMQLAAKAHEQAVELINPFVSTSPASSVDLMGWLARIGVIVVLAGLVVRISAETTMKAVAKVRFSNAGFCETSSLLSEEKSEQPSL